MKMDRFLCRLTISCLQKMYRALTSVTQVWLVHVFEFCISEILKEFSVSSIEILSENTLFCRKTKSCSYNCDCKLQTVEFYMLEIFFLIEEWVQNHDILLFWQVKPSVHVFQVNLRQIVPKNSMSVLFHTLKSIE